MLCPDFMCTRDDVGVVPDDTTVVTTFSEAQVMAVSKVVARWGLYHADPEMKVRELRNRCDDMAREVLRVAAEHAND